MKISLIFPIFNEAQNIPILLEKIYAVLINNSYNYEIIAVDDGSNDDSFSILEKYANKDLNIKVIRFAINRGQTAALSAGIENASGDVLIPMDSDLENDPGDIPKLIAKIDEGYDVVSGWRIDRWKGGIIIFFKRRLPSKLANWLISIITGVYLHDYGCIMKAYRSHVIANIILYGEMHRFIPAYSSWHGAKVVEVPVSYQSRKYGKSNYGIGRTFKVLLDLIVIVFLHRYMNRPIHFFGGLGFISLAIGILSGLIAMYLKITHLRDFVSTPLPIFSALFIIVGVQLIAMGIIAEILMRTYYESQKKKPYSITETINI